jgi:phage internal scaffolding protein
MFRHPHKRVSIDFTGTYSVTEQSHKDECDIHKILNQYKRTGILTHIQKQQPLYMDLPEAAELQQSYEIIRDAHDAFAALPASVRDRFKNDPKAFLGAFADPSMQDELRGLGLLNPRPAPPVDDTGTA